MGLSSCPVVELSSWNWTTGQPERHRPKELENVARQVDIFDDVAESLADIVAVDQELLPGQLVRAEGQIVEQAFENRMQSPCADVLGALVHRGGEAGDLH